LQAGAKVRVLLVSLISVSAFTASAEICGVVRGQNKVARITLEDEQSGSEMIRFKIKNSQRFNWVVGSCTCVEPSFVVESDSHGFDYLIDIKRITSVDESGLDCRPGFFP
jgi:hypothetical protein